MKSVKFFWQLVAATYLLSCVAVVAQTNVSKDEWKVFRVRELLSFSAPRDFRFVSSMPSNLSRNGSFEMIYTNGMQSMYLGVRTGTQGPFDYKKAFDVEESIVEVSGLKARLVTFHLRGVHGPQYIAVMYFPHGESGKQPPVVMWARCIDKAEQELAVRIFRSVEWLSPPPNKGMHPTAK